MKKLMRIVASVALCALLSCAQVPFAAVAFADDAQASAQATKASSKKKTETATDSDASSSASSSESSDSSDSSKSSDSSSSTDSSDSSDSSASSESSKSSSSSSSSSSASSKKDVTDAMKDAGIETDDKETDEGDGISLSLPTSGRQAEEFTVTVSTFSQENDVETAAAFAMKQWETSEYAIVVSVDSWKDAAISASLAGCLDCPVLYTYQGEVPETVSNLLAEMQVKQVIVVGTQDVVSDDVVRALSDSVERGAQRVCSSTGIDNSGAVFMYGLKHGLWNSKIMFVVPSNDPEYAVSLEPVAYALGAPMLFANANGNLEPSLMRQLDTLSDLGVYKVSYVGVSGNYKDVSYSLLSFLESTYEGNAIALSGESDVNALGTKASAIQVITSKSNAQASIEIGSWAVDQEILNREYSIFFASSDPVDCAAISAMQGKAGGLSMMVDAGSATTAVDEFTKSEQKSLCIVGCQNHIDPSVETIIEDHLVIEGVSYYDAGASLDKVVSAHVASASGTGMPNYTEEQALQCIDPSNFYFGNAEYYQFAVLSDGYSGAVTAEELDAFINSMVGASEASYGVTSKFRGAGKYFIEAAKKWQVNEVYLLCHAALESAWGCSPFAQGTISGYNGYYNFFGISCYDTNPTVGAAYAKSQGWDTVEKAINGAARWISVGIGSSGGYINANYAQNTLYLMKWNLNSSGFTHEYATGRTWAVGIARIMGKVYDYLDIPMENTGLRFQVPVY